MDSYLLKQIKLLEQNPHQAEEMFPVQLAGHSRIEGAAWTALYERVVKPG